MTHPLIELLTARIAGNAHDDHHLLCLADRLIRDESQPMGIRMAALLGLDRIVTDPSFPTGSYSVFAVEEHCDEHGERHLRSKRTSAAEEIMDRLFDDDTTGE